MSRLQAFFSFDKHIEDPLYKHSWLLVMKQLCPRAEGVCLIFIHIACNIEFRIYSNDLDKFEAFLSEYQLIPVD